MGKAVKTDIEYKGHTGQHTEPKRRYRQQKNNRANRRQRIFYRRSLSAYQQRNRKRV